MTRRQEQRDVLNETLEGISCSEGCSSCFALIFCIVLSGS